MTSEIPETRINKFEVPDSQALMHVQKQTVPDNEAGITSFCASDPNVELSIPQTTYYSSFQFDVNDKAIQTEHSFPPKQYVFRPAFYESQIYHLEKEIDALKKENARLKKLGRVKARQALPAQSRKEIVVLNVADIDLL